MPQAQASQKTNHYQISLSEQQRQDLSLAVLYRLSELEYRLGKFDFDDGTSDEEKEISKKWVMELGRLRDLRAKLNGTGNSPKQEK